MPERMNRAERRARKHWQGEPVDPLTALVCAQASFAVAAAESGAAMLKIASTDITPAQMEAVNRWAVPAAAAFRRATADLERITAQLTAITGTLEVAP